MASIHGLRSAKGNEGTTSASALWGGFDYGLQ